MGVKKIISRASSTEHGEILEKLGAEVIYPERDMAVRLASRFKSNLILDFVQLNEVYLRLRFRMCWQERLCWRQAFAVHLI